MALYADSSLPAVATLAAEGIAVKGLRDAPTTSVVVGVLNLMPLKIPTETDLLRAFSECDADVVFRFFTTATHKSRNTPAEHISRFYSCLDADAIAALDALVITGAPVEKIEYADVDYYREFCDILDEANRRHRPALLLCWAAFAGLFRRYGLQRTILEKKISGVYAHDILLPRHPLTGGLAAPLYAPQSRFVIISGEAVAAAGADLVAASTETGVHIAATPGCDEVFITGHGEYALDTLRNEYERDMSRGLSPSLPCNYFADDDPSKPVVERWQAAGRRIFSNWVSLTAVPRKLARGHRSEEAVQ